MALSDAQKARLRRAVTEAEAEMAKANWPAATKSWQKLARKLGSDNSKVWVMLSRSARLSGDLDLAMSAAKAGLKSFPEEKELRKELAKASTAAGVWAEAAEAWGQTIELFHDNATSEMRLGQLRAQAELALAKCQWTQALAAWQQMVAELGPARSQLKLQGRFYISILKRLINIDDYRQQIGSYQASQTPRKIAVVTAVSRGYDSLKPPEVVDPRFDYLCYTDDPTANGMGIYQIRPLPTPDLDPARAIRYVKTHPHKLFGKYDVVVWLDTAVMIVGDIYPLIEQFMKSSQVIGSGVHPLRKDIYEEFEAGATLKKENLAIMKKQIKFYQSQGFSHTDLSENTLLMFKPGSPKLAQAMETWWEQICKFSKRDQLSFNYSLSKNQVKWFPLTQPPQDIRNHPLFVWMPHHSQQPVLEALTRQLS